MTMNRARIPFVCELKAERTLLYFGWLQKGVVVSQVCLLQTLSREKYLSKERQSATGRTKSADAKGKRGRKVEQQNQSVELHRSDEKKREETLDRMI